MCRGRRRERSCRRRSPQSTVVKVTSAATSPSAGCCTGEGALGAPRRIFVAVVIGDQTLELGRNERAHRGTTTGGQHLRLLDHVLIELHRQVPLRHWSSRDCGPQYSTCC